MYWRVYNDRKCRCLLKFVKISIGYPSAKQKKYPVGIFVLIYVFWISNLFAESFIINKQQTERTKATYVIELNYGLNFNPRFFYSLLSFLSGMKLQEDKKVSQRCPYKLQYYKTKNRIEMSLIICHSKRIIFGLLKL